jgi:2-keto-4-pentenoate hydratase/2-oxohepta-3-ene-1,7-dioic acid hydratase in catechol pathway
VEEGAVGFVVVRGTGERITVSKIVAAGQNYADHTKEMGAAPSKAPILFLKPASAIVHEGDPIVFPRAGDLLHHEVELGVVVARECRSVPATEAAEQMLGYALALDLTLRDVQAAAKEKGHPWSVAKGFDCSCPISDVVPLEDPAVLTDMEIGLSVDGEVRQRGSTADMIWSPAELLSFASGIFTLERGDVILTGTPAGVGPLERGNVVEAWLGTELTLRFDVV